VPDALPNHHIFFLLFPSPGARDAALAHLRGRGIEVSFHYVPLHSSPQGRRLGLGDMRLPVTDRVAATLLRLPVHPLLEEEEVARVVDALLQAPV
jgi:dTDP-4-amino-4,6-dideoxygalactose transaminase